MRNLSSAISKYGGVTMKPLSDGSYYITYQDEDKLATKITKPLHLGSFILGYSRMIMHSYLQKSNPYFDSTLLEKQLENSQFIQILIVFRFISETCKESTLIRKLEVLVMI